MKQYSTDTYEKAHKRSKEKRAALATERNMPVLIVGAISALVIIVMLILGGCS